MGDFKSKTWYGKLIEGALTLVAMLVIAFLIGFVTGKVAILKTILDFGFRGFTVGKSIALTLGIWIISKWYKPKTL